MIFLYCLQEFLCTEAQLTAVSAGLCLLSARFVQDVSDSCDNTKHRSAGRKLRRQSGVFCMVFSLIAQKKAFPAANPSQQRRKLPRTFRRR